MVCLLAAAGAAFGQESAPIFERDVLPILAARCLGCHGGVTKKAELDLRDRASIERGGRKGPAIVSGKPAESLLWKAIADDRMPKEDPKLSDREKDVIRRWIETGAREDGSLRGDAPPPSAASRKEPAAVAAEIDRSIDAELLARRVASSPLAAGVDLFRRVHLDLAGRIPAADKTERFLAAGAAGDIDREIETLMGEPAFADRLAEMWHDVIVPLDLNRRVYNDTFLRWIAERIRADEPWNATVHRMLSGAGDTRVDPSLGFFRAHRRPNLMAREATRIFLGVRTECVQCHDHPFARISQADYWGQAAFFSHTQVKRETQPTPGFLVRDVDEPQFGGASGGTLKIPANAIRNVDRVVQIHFLDGGVPKLDGAASYRRAYADWATDRKNPYFAKATVNRLWAHFFGEGLVHPVDDIVGLQPPTAPAVLNLLAGEFAASDFDLRHVVRCIVATRAYRRSARAAPGEAADETGLARMKVRPLSPAMLHDSLCVVLGREAIDFDLDPTSDVSLGSNPRSRFVNLFNTQDAEQESSDYNHGVLQALRLMNGKAFQASKVDLERILPGDAGVERNVERLFLRALSRQPNSAEAERFVAHVRGRPSLEAGYADVLWALINSAEFLMQR